MRQARRLTASLIVAGGMIAAVDARAQDFYAGKTVDFIVGADVGGGYDVYARTLARHLPKHLPGTPNVVVKNMPGAGSAVAAANLYNIAAKDGSVIGALMPGAILDRILNEKAKGNFDPSKFNYLASADSGARVCMTFQTSKAKTFADTMNQKIIMGASAAGGATRDYAFMVSKAAGAQFNVVSGYKGTADIFLAMERGEVDGMCGLDWNSLKAQKADWLRDGKLNVILQTAIDPHPELVGMKTPEIWPSIKSDMDKKAVSLVLSQQVFLRSYIAPPGVPAERVKLLRDAFAKTLADKELLAEAAKVKIDINPSPGEKVQALVESLYATPPDIVQRARELTTP